MHGDLLIVVGILILGCAAFLFGVVYAVCSAIKMVARGMFFALFPRQRHSTGRQGLRRGALICPQPNCRRIEHRPAKFCARCGTALTETATPVRQARPIETAT